jgi:hypothetical protein
MQFPTYREYENILNSSYVQNPIEMSVGFFGLCSYQHVAWDYVFGSIRQFYPDAPIVLINDGMDVYDYSEIAKKHNCIYLRKEIEICLHYPDIQGSYEFLERVRECCQLAKTEWMIHLHPDVICQGKISYFPCSYLSGVSCGSYTGKSNNMWEQKAIDYIRQYQPNAELNGWGWCGGSIVNVQAFNQVYHSVIGKDAKFSLEHIRSNIGSYVTEHEDTMMSTLFELNGFPYRIWKDNPEYHRGKRVGAFLHGYKGHYDFVKQGLNVSEYYTKVRTQNIVKRQRNGQLDGQQYQNNNIDLKYI